MRPNHSRASGLLPGQQISNLLPGHPGICGCPMRRHRPSLEWRRVRAGLKPERLTLGHACESCIVMPCPGLLAFRFRAGRIRILQIRMWHIASAARRSESLESTIEQLKRARAKSTSQAKIEREERTQTNTTGHPQPSPGRGLSRTATAGRASATQITQTA